VADIFPAIGEEDGLAIREVRPDLVPGERVKLAEGRACRLGRGDNRGATGE
jgi:hypothetical protein